MGRLAYWEEGFAVRNDIGGKSGRDSFPGGDATRSLSLFAQNDNKKDMSDLET